MLRATTSRTVSKMGKNIEVTRRWIYPNSREQDFMIARWGQGIRLRTNGTGSYNRDSYILALVVLYLSLRV